MISSSPGSITWRKLPGNKFSRALHPAMLSSRCYQKLSVVEPIGHGEKGEYVVSYDKTYVIKWLSMKVVRPLQLIGYQGLCELLAEAWEDFTGKPVEARIDPDEIPFSDAPESTIFGSLIRQHNEWEDI